MHIVVTIKQVVDPNTPSVLLKIGKDGVSLELPVGMSQIMNGYDANAVEAALALKDKHGGTVTVLSVGDETSKNCLRRAIGMGADRGVHIAGPTGLACDSAVIAKLLGAAVRKLGFVDLVLCGRQASDTDAAQVPFLLAGELDLPVISPVKNIQGMDDDSAIVDRIGEGCTQRLQVKLPALLGISNEINKPRPAPLKGVMLAKKAEIPTWTHSDLGIEAPQPAMTLRRLYIEPPVETCAELIAAESARAAGRALADRLRQEGLI
ncbi:MAG TPA: electron transfer flavoprotein subunit beta/FixA family protein [Dongiaceae bacterium]|jgi:electron transfer flavoprotein beta subunit|nr:electron transfer flavoprotein subunit beta/FixA family protein [Dongiaceae bacterium]